MPYSIFQKNKDFLAHLPNISSIITASNNVLTDLITDFHIFDRNIYVLLVITELFMPLIHRLLLDEIMRWVERKEIIAIKGPRQSGKTTLLRMIRDRLLNDGKTTEERIVYATFEDRGELDAFSVNPKEYILRHLKGTSRHYFLLDEAQYCKEIGRKLKLLFDLYDNVKFFVTGSSSLELKNETGKYLVGRMLEFELLPLSFEEFLNFKDPKLSELYVAWNRKLIDLIVNGAPLESRRSTDIIGGEISTLLNEFITFGGYPAIVTMDGDKEKRFLLDNLVNTYLDRDIVSFLQITDTIKFRRLLKALSSMDGGLLNVSELSSQIGSYFKELSYLMDVLEQTYVIRRLRPFHLNLLTELRKIPKLYFVDTGLRNALIDNFTSLEGRPDSGVLAENFVLNELSRHVGLNYWRTTSMTEVDFVASGKSILPVEVKYKTMTKPKAGKSFYGFLKNYEVPEALVVTKDFWGRLQSGRTSVNFIPICYL